MASLNNIYINEFYRSYFNTNKKRPQGKLDKPLWGLRVDGGWRLVAGEPRLPLVILSETKDLGIRR